MMNTVQKSKVLSSKKECFRKEIRTQYLNKYMRKIRAEVNDSLEYQSLKNLLLEPLEQENYKSFEEVIAKKRNKLKQLIKYANFGYSCAIVQISDLLLEDQITIQMIQTIQEVQPQDKENYQNQNSMSSHNSLSKQKKLENKKQIMQIINFPDKNNEGWLAFIRVLVGKGLCTTEMIYYCLKTIVKSLSIYALYFSLQIIYVLVVDKKLVKIQEIVRQILAFSSQTSQKRQEKTLQTLTPYSFFMKLLEKSGSSTKEDGQSEIRYFSMKILLKCFYSSTLMEEVFLKVIPLACISQYLVQKFNFKSSSMWTKTKTIKMMSSLLITLSDFNQYNLKKIIQVLLKPLQLITELLYVTSQNIYLRNSHQVGYNNERRSQFESTFRGYQQNVGFLQQGVFLLDLIVDDYFSTHNDLQVMNAIMEKLKINYILIYLYGAYIEEVNKLKYNEQQERHLSNINQNQRQISFYQEQRNGLTLQEMCKCLLIQKIEQILSKMLMQFNEVQNKINSNDIVFNRQQKDKFQHNKVVFLVRLRQSEIRLNNNQNYQLNQTHNHTHNKDNSNNLNSNQQIEI